MKTVKLIAIEKLIERATEREDHDVQLRLQEIVDDKQANAFIDVHKSCYCSYTSKVHVVRVQKRRHTSSEQIDEVAVASVRRSQTLLVGTRSNFKEHCWICSQPCLPLDPRHPDRWDRIVQCETLDRPGLSSFRDIVLDVAEQRNDEIFRTALRNIGVERDLPARDAQYHKRCYDNFMCVPKYSNLTGPTVVDTALSQAIDHMYANQNRFWNSIDVHVMYSSFGGELNRRQMFTKLVSCLGDDAIVLRMEGCATIIGFKEFASKNLKLVQTDAADEESVIDVVVRTVKKEARAVKGSATDYELAQFTYAHTLAHTSSTLLTLVSELVSDGKVSKKSISLSQAIQTHITGARNQTTLGLAVKLHHRHGSSELIKDLHQHGFVVSYDEVLRFRKSAAKFVME